MLKVHVCGVSWAVMSKRYGELGGMTYMYRFKALFQVAEVLVELNTK